MKKIVSFSFFCIVSALFLTCKKPYIPPENTYIGKWEVALFYANGINVPLA